MSSDLIKFIQKDADFEPEVLKCSVPVLVQFTATWTGPCKALRPIIERIASDDQGKVKVAEVDVDDCIETSKKYGVDSVPTVLIFKDGQKVGQSIGLTSRENLLKMLDI